jgi:hypothetical protein
MPARFNAFPPDRAALTRLLEDGELYRIGRDDSCELRLDHASVSRMHATLDSSAGAWMLADNASKNGVRVNGAPVVQAHLRELAWFAIGDVYCSLEPIDTAAAARLRQQQESRRIVSHWLSDRLSPSLGTDALIAQTLDVVLELVGLERGFVLYAPPGEPLRVRAYRGMVTTEFGRAEFAGSVAAVEQALGAGRSVICCDTNESPWLGARPSVRLGGIRAVLCVPLQVARDCLGALYADSRRPGPAVTELDLELIETVAGHAAAVLSARQLRGEVAELLQAAAGAGLHAPRWDELLNKTNA